MNNFENAEIELISFSTEDVITTSGGSIFGDVDLFLAN